MGTILSLQEDSDMAYFGLDLAPILAACAGRIDHVRRPLRDFDAHSLRMGLPAAVAALQRSMQRQGGTAYIHCTAGAMMCGHILGGGGRACQVVGIGEPGPVGPQVCPRVASCAWTHCCPAPRGA